jgi:copper transport protein
MRRVLGLSRSQCAGRRTPLRVSWVVGGVCVVALLLPARALAHATPVRIQPGDGAVVNVGPTTVRIFFDQGVRAEPGMRAVRNTGGSVLDGAPRVEGGRELVIPLRSGLRPGGYTVLWRVLSEDGHPVAGITTFAVGAGQPRPHAALAAPSEGKAVPGLERWLFLTGILLAAGLSVFRVVMPRTAAPPLRLLVGSFALVVGGGAALVARTSVSTRFGLVAAMAIIIALAGALAAVGATRVPRLAVGAWLSGLALVVLPSAMGHALDPGRSWIEFPVDVLHVAASSVWFGGVVALVVGLRRGAVDDRVVRRFSTLALAAVGVIGVTGLIRALAELSSIDQVWGTSYGQLLIVKTTLLGALVVLGWANRYRVIPALARSAQRLRLNLRAEIVLLLAVVGAVALLTQSRPGRDRVLASPAVAAVGARVPETPAEAVVLAQAPGAVQVAGVAANSVSVDGSSVFWETVAAEEGGSAALVERNLATRRTRTLVRDVASQFGLAVTRNTIVYAPASAPVRLVALDRRTGRRTVLSRSVAAPLAWGGERVAWAEEQGGRQRVVVYNLLRRKAWTAADMPSCVGGVCYRVDAVTLAQQGVVFTRDVVGAQASSVGRRAFSAPRPEFVKIERDPQPDLVPSASGALYYALDRGWYRWDFGEAQPRRAVGSTTQSLRPIAYDGRRWFLVRTRGCDDSVQSTRSGNVAMIASPAHARAVAHVGADVCVRFQNLTWAGRRSVTTWIVVPRATHATGATGVIVVGPSTRVG